MQPKLLKLVVQHHIDRSDDNFYEAVYNASSNKNKIETDFELSSHATVPVNFQFTEDDIDLSELYKAVKQLVSNEKKSQVQRWQNDGRLFFTEPDEDNNDTSMPGRKPRHRDPRMNKQPGCQGPSNHTTAKKSPPLQPQSPASTEIDPHEVSTDSEGEAGEMDLDDEDNPGNIRKRTTMHAHVAGGRNTKQQQQTGKRVRFNRNLPPRTADAGAGGLHSSLFPDGLLSSIQSAEERYQETAEDNVRLKEAAEQLKAQLSDLKRAQQRSQETAEEEVKRLNAELREAAGTKMRWLQEELKCRALEEKCRQLRRALQDRDQHIQELERQLRDTEDEQEEVLSREELLDRLNTEDTSIYWNALWNFLAFELGWDVIKPVPIGVKHIADVLTTSNVDVKKKLLLHKDLFTANQNM